MSSAEVPSLSGAPPISPLPLPEKQPAWIMVVGVISIVLGAGGVLTNCVNAISCLFIWLSPDTFGQVADTGGTLESTVRWGPWLAAIGILSFMVSALLLWAGIAMVRRRRMTVRLHYAWCAARAVVGILSAVVAMLYTRDLMSAQQAMMQGAGGAPPAFVGGFMQAMGVFSLIAGVLWALAYPVFIVIWLAREPVKREIARWA